MSDGLIISNVLLAATEMQVEISVTLETRLNYLRAVNAGMKVMQQGAMDEILASVKNSSNPLCACADAAINLAFRKHPRNPLPLKSVIPASETLMLKILDAAERAGMIKVDNAAVVRATRIWADLVFRKFNITGQMLQNAAANVYRLAQDPASVEKMKRSARDLTKPNTSLPVQMRETVH